MHLRALILPAAVGLLLAGCGDDGATPPPPEESEETLDRLPDLPRGYEEFLNADVGVAFGRPPGWSAKAKGNVSTLVAPDGLVSATITIDRTDDALAGGPKDFATETAELLPSYEEPLAPGEAEPFEHPYQGAVAEAEGVAERSGVSQRVRVVVLERDGVAVVTAIIAENAREDAGAEARQALKAVATLRTRPPL